MDSWDGYPAARDRLIDVIKSNNLENLVVLTGDVHASWAANLKADFDDPNSKIFGVEFVGTSITSGGNGADKRADTDKILSQNPHIKFFNDYRGYVRCKVTPEQWKADYRVVPFVTEPGADISTRASFVEEDRTRAHNRAHEKQRMKSQGKVTN
jgi:alkaline phosphatase D